jgi:hypothetical protein
MPAEPSEGLECGWHAARSKQEKSEQAPNEGRGRHGSLTVKPLSRADHKWLTEVCRPRVAETAPPRDQGRTARQETVSHGTSDGLDRR